jgi:DNA-binding NarL/FixJ family response regulator
MRQTTIVVIDDHPLFRQGVVDILSVEKDLKVIGQASNGVDGLWMIRERKPEVALIDVNLPGMNGLQVTRQISLEKLGARVILLTAYDDTDQKIHAVRSGAAAYCTKDVQPKELIEVIQKVSLTDQEIIAEDLNLWMVNRTETVENGSGKSLHPLSGREIEVLTYITQGLSNKEIATILGISQQTIKNHVTAILRKLGVADRTQAAIFALRHGWVRMDEQYPSSEE